MKVSLKSIPHISNKILTQNVKNEMALEEKADEICQENEEEIEFMLADERQLFFMIKKKLAPEYDIILNYEERYSDISHKILDELYEEDLIHFEVTENRIKNIIYNAITSFIADSSEIQDAVMDKIRSYKRHFIPGTDEYEILYEKLYRQEMTKRGME